VGLRKNGQGCILESSAKLSDTSKRISAPLDEILIFGYNEKSSPLLIAFVHAILFAFILLKKGIDQNRNDSPWLAAFVFMGGLYICPFMLGYAGWYSVQSYKEFMFFFPFQQLFLIGPVFFFYVQTLLHPNLKLSRRDYLHFLPAIVYLVYTLIVFVTDKLILDEFYFYADNQDKDLDFWYQMAGLLSMLFYLVLSLRNYLDYRKRSLEEVSFADEIAYKWIKHFIIALGLILVLRVLFFIVNPEWGQFGRKFWYYLCFSILLMYISISGFAHTLQTTLGLGVSALPKVEPVTPQESIEEEKAPDETLAVEEWKEKITRLFEQKRLYTNPTLTLKDVASQLQTNRNIISGAINQAFQMNFNDFVNERRAEAVIEKLQRGEHAQNTLLGIALDCGFNSKTTFNRAFKKHTGTTPRQFIAKHAL